MSSQRKEIRHYVRDLLKGKTDCGENVFANRMRNVFELELPSILIYTKHEPVSIFTTAPREYERVLNLVIEVVASADDDLDDILDDISDQIEYWMHQDHTKGELTGDTTLKNTEMNISAQGDQLIGSAVLTYEMPYYTEATRDSKELNILAHANLQINAFHTDDAASGIDSEDDIFPVTGGL